MVRKDLIERNRNIALIGITIALIIVLQALAEVIQLFGLQISLALGLIPVLVISQLKGWKIGAICGLAFGIVSMSIAAIRYSAVPVFRNAINPLVSVMPRILVGIVTGALASTFSKLSLKWKERGKYKLFTRKYFLSAVATLAGVLTNTIGFLGMFFVFSADQSVGGYTVNIAYIFGMIVAINTVVEAISYVVLVPAITESLRVTKFFSPSTDKKQTTYNPEDSSITNQEINSDKQNENQVTIETKTPFEE
ncbi:MAG: ECF transporter S component [Clostridia bacterium]|nr:ECF transporter S component [Clostridia bacterium]